MSASVELNSSQTDRIIEMAWEDCTSFDAIKLQFGFSELQVINIFKAYF